MAFFAFQDFKQAMIARALHTFANQKAVVSTSIATVQSWQPTYKAIGSLKAERGAVLSLDASGIIKNILFKSGQHVRAGQPLLELRDKDELSKFQALQANATLSRLTYQRDEEQFQFRAISKATLQSAKYAWKNATALANEEKHLLQKKILRAPFSGRLGIRLVDVGQYLTPGAGIVELQSLHKMHVDFMLPQRDLRDLRVGQIIHAHIDAFPRITFLGHITAINSLVNSTSRNVEVRAALKHSRFPLLPGMFATIAISSGRKRSYVTLPQTAISYNSYGDTIYFIHRTKSGFVARQTFIVVGPKRGDKVAILSGISAGAQVVTSGQIKLHNGSIVLINNSMPPATKAYSAQVEE
jgi:membrane fusion protein (multidrug efflux system)